MGSGLIYAVIIAMWGAYFIPRWLRRHEERSEARSVDRFSHAMRILSGRSSAADAETPGGDPPSNPRTTVAGATPGTQREAPGPAVRRSKAARSLVLRRRRILAGLLLLSVAMSVLTPLTPVPWPLGLLPGVATLVYLLHLRLQARRSRELSRTRNSVRRRTLARLRRFDSAERIFQARGSLREERALAEAERLAAAQAADEADGQDPAAWQPVPVPLPTYVTKPVVPRATPRPADDAATQEPFDQTAAARPASSPAARAPHRGQPDELDRMMERRAVND